MLGQDIKWMRTRSGILRERNAGVDTACVAARSAQARLHRVPWHDPCMMDVRRKGTSAYACTVVLVLSDPLSADVTVTHGGWFGF